MNPVEQEGLDGERVPVEAGIAGGRLPEQSSTGGAKVALGSSQMGPRLHICEKEGQPRILGELAKEHGEGMRELVGEGKIGSTARRNPKIQIGEGAIDEGWTDPVGGVDVFGAGHPRKSPLGARAARRLVGEALRVQGHGPEGEAIAYLLLAGGHASDWKSCGQVTSNALLS
jgi:hypothetical protein